MRSRDFCYWLQGFFEVAGKHTRPNGYNDALHITPSQAECIQKHLALVFIHEIDPSMPSNELDTVHNPMNIGPSPSDIAKKTIEELEKVTRIKDANSTGPMRYRC